MMLINDNELELTIITQNSKRYSYVDVIKGIGILLVVFQHCMGGRNLPDTLPWISLFIASFHMPLFFIISGYLYKRKDTNSYLSGKVKSLLIPYLIVMIINLGTTCLFAFIEKVFCCGNYSSYIQLEGFWFLLSLLYVTIMYYIVDVKVTTKLHNWYLRKLCSAFVAIFVLITGLIISCFSSGNPNIILNSLVGYFFFCNRTFL